MNGRLTFSILPKKFYQLINVSSLHKKLCAFMKNLNSVYLHY